MRECTTKFAVQFNIIILIFLKKYYSSDIIFQTNTCTRFEQISNVLLVTPVEEMLSSCGCEMAVMVAVELAVALISEGFDGVANSLTVGFDGTVVAMPPCASAIFRRNELVLTLLSLRRRDTETNLFSSHINVERHANRCIFRKAITSNDSVSSVYSAVSPRQIIAASIKTIVESHSYRSAGVTRDGSARLLTRETKFLENRSFNESPHRSQKN